MAARLDITEPPRQPHGGGRVPPHDLQAEESLLGAMMLSAGAIGDVTGTVTASDFYKPAHGHIFDAIHTLYAPGQPVDAVTVADELAGPGSSSRSAGPPSSPRSSRSTPGHHQRGALRQHRRGVLAAPPADRRGGRDRRARLLRARGRAEGARPGRVARLRGERAPRHRLDEAAVVAAVGEPRPHRGAHERARAITGTPTGYLDLDLLLSGLQPSSLVIVGARPAMGKTSFALGMLAHAALEAPDPKPCLFFSLEMSHLELTQRLLCSEAKVDSHRLRNGQLKGDDWSKISHAMGRLGQAPIFIDDNPNLTIMEIRAKARRLKSQVGKLGMIVDRLPAADDRPVERREPPGRGVRAQPGPQDPREGARDARSSRSASSAATSRCAPTSAPCSPTSVRAGRSSRTRTS